MENNNLITVLEAIAKLSKQVSEFQQEIVSLASRPQKAIAAPTSSKETKELFSALAKAQGEFKIAGLSKENPYYKSKYADLTDLVKASRVALSKYGLSVIQKVVIDTDGPSILRTILQHSSGQWTDSSARLTPPKADIQSYGSYKSYMKRYEYGSLVGVIAANEDDDGEIAVHDERVQFNKGTRLTHKYNPKEETYESITKEQLEEIRYELASHTDITEDILEKMKLQSLADMPKSKFLSAIRRIREIVQTRDGR